MAAKKRVRTRKETAEHDVGAARPAPVTVAPRAEQAPEGKPVELPVFREHRRVQAIQVAEVDARLGQVRDQHGVVWPIVDRRVLDSGAAPGEWLVVLDTGEVVKMADRDFKLRYEPVTGVW